MIQGRRPTWRATLARDVPASEAHRAEVGEGFFGFRAAVCDRCAFEARLPADELAALVAKAVGHAPRVRVFADGQEVANGAREQRAARRRWDRGEARTVSEAIASRLNGGGRMDNGKDGAGEETGEQEEELGMSDRIRAAARADRSGRRRDFTEGMFGKPEKAGETGEGTNEAGDAGGQEE